MSLPRLVILLLFTFPLMAVADPVADTGAPQGAAQAQPQSQSGDSTPQPSRPRLAIAGSPRYYSLYNGGNVTTFGTLAGLDSPKNYAVGFELLVYGIIGEGWQLGLGLGGMGYSSDNAINSATYSQGYLGAWLGKDFQLNESFDTSIGGLLAVGVAQTELVNLGPSGRTTETSFMMEPKLTVAYRTSSWCKLGLSGSYLIPTFERQRIRGNNLTGNANISARGPSAGFEFIFDHIF